MNSKQPDLWMLLSVCQVGRGLLKVQIKLAHTELVPTEPLFDRGPFQQVSAAPRCQHSVLSAALTLVTGVSNCQHSKRATATQDQRPSTVLKAGIPLSVKVSRSQVCVVVLFQFNNLLPSVQQLLQTCWQHRLQGMQLHVCCTRHSWTLWSSAVGV